MPWYVTLLLCPWSFETSNPLSLHPDIPFCAQSIQSTNVRLIFQTHSSCFVTPYSLTNQASLSDHSSAQSLPLKFLLTWPSSEVWSYSHRHPSLPQVPTHPSPVIFLSFCYCSCCSTQRKHLPFSPPTIKYHLCLGPSPVPSFSEAFSNIVPLQSPLFFSTHSFYTVPLTLIVYFIMQLIKIYETQFS